MVMWQGDRQQYGGSLVDILDRVLDKGLVVAGDIRVSVANVELLSIKIRLLICSVDKAQEIGLDWWRHDSFLSSEAEKEVEGLRARIEALESQLALPDRPRPESVEGLHPESAEGQNVAPQPPPNPRRRARRRRQEDEKE